QRSFAAFVEEEHAAEIQVVRLQIGGPARSGRGGRRGGGERGVRAAVEVRGGAGATVVAAGVGADAVLPDSSGETAATIADEISSCILNTSLDSRSNMSDQTVNPSVVFTRRAVTRMRPRSRWTVPTSTMFTPSALPRSTGLAA